MRRVLLAITGLLLPIVNSVDASQHLPSVTPSSAPSPAPSLAPSADMPWSNNIVRGISVSKTKHLANDGVQFDTVLPNGGCKLDVIVPSPQDYISATFDLVNCDPCAVGESIAPTTSLRKKHKTASPTSNGGEIGDELVVSGKYKDGCTATMVFSIDRQSATLFNDYCPSKCAPTVEPTPSTHSRLRG